MTTARRQIRMGSSIRTRFLVVVFIGAVIPLVLIGVWQTRSVVRAGEDLLHNDLDRSLQKVTDAAADRWSYVSGDLELLAANDVAQRIVANNATPLSSNDSSYLDQLSARVATRIPMFEYHDAANVARWTATVRRVDTTEGRTGRSDSTKARSFRIVEPIVAAAGGSSKGFLQAEVLLSALVPSDTALRLPNGAMLQLLRRDSQEALLPAFADDSLLEHDRFAVNGVEWLSVHRTLEAPQIDLILAAPLNEYVLPFQRAARTSLVTLAVVALVALFLTAYLTTRLTSSLKQLAVAADAIADGDIDQRVDARGSDEISRVGAAFNTMVENLRRTLHELSQRQALSAAGEYAAALSHQVRNGLTAVRVDLQFAEERSAVDAPSRPLIARALDNVKRIDTIVTTSLHGARTNTAPRRRMDLRTSLRTAMQTAEGAFRERGATLSQLPVNEPPVWVLGDPASLEQVFLNVLLNAAQAGKLGGRASVELETIASDCVITVTDDGTGIAAEHLERVLEPFFSTKPDSTGLGLSIARQIVTAHGGSLRLESELGKGTRVECRIPVVPGPDAHGNAISPPVE